MALGDERLRSIVESLLLISPDPVPVTRLVEVIRIEDPHTSDETIRAAIDALLDTYAAPDRPMARGFRVEEVAGGLQLRTVPENAPFVRRYLAAKPQRLSKAALETLAIVAYRQPVTKPEIEAIRGVDVGAALRSLLERDLLKIVGKKDEVGRPLLYGTTPYFLEFFTLKSLSELPTLREFHELDEASLEEVAALEGDDAPSVAELANAAQFLVEREADPELDALDEAVKAADAAKAAAEAALDPLGAGGAPAPRPESEAADGPGMGRDATADIEGAPLAGRDSNEEARTPGAGRDAPADIEGAPLAGRDSNEEARTRAGAGSEGEAAEGRDLERSADAASTGSGARAESADAVTPGEASGPGPADEGAGPADEGAGPADEDAGPADVSAGPAEGAGPAEVSGAEAGPADEGAGASGAEAGPADEASRSGGSGDPSARD